MRILRKLLKVRNLKIAKVAVFAEFAGYIILVLNVNNRLTTSMIQQHAIYSVTTRYLRDNFRITSGVEKVRLGCYIWQRDIEKLSTILTILVNTDYICASSAYHLRNICYHMAEQDVGNGKNHRAANIER